MQVNVNAITLNPCAAKTLTDREKKHAYYTLKYYCIQSSIFIYLRSINEKSTIFSSRLLPLSLFHFACVHTQIYIYMNRKHLTNQIKVREREWRVENYRNTESEKEQTTITIWIYTICMKHECDISVCVYYYYFTDFMLKKISTHIHWECIYIFHFEQFNASNTNYFFFVFFFNLSFFVRQMTGWWKLKIAKLLPVQSAIEEKHIKITCIQTQSHWHTQTHTIVCHTLCL